MPSCVHDGLVDLYRHRPDLAFRLARLLGIPVAPVHLEHRQLGREFVDPSRPKVRYEADLVIGGLVETQSGAELIESIGIEVQLGVDSAKFVSLPIYRAGIRSQTHQRGWTMMISPVRRVLMWAEQHLFPHEPELRPITVGPDQVDPVLDLGVAREDPEWAVLCAVLHARTLHAIPAADVALEAIKSLPRTRYDCYRQLLEATRKDTTMDEDFIRVPDVDDDISEFEMEGYLYQSGLRRGRKEGRKEGLEQGLEQGLRDALLALLTALGLAVDDDSRARVSECDNPETLREWLCRAPRITHPRELFA